MNPENDVSERWVRHLCEAMMRNGWSDEVMYNACNGRFLSEVRKVLDGRARIVEEERRRIIVDHSQSWEQMVLAAQFGWVSPKITPTLFTLEGSGVVEYETQEFWFNWNILTSQAINLIQKADENNPWQPAQAAHAIAYATKYPEQQLKYPIVSLGSVATIGTKQFALRLYRGGADRACFLFLNDWNGGWNYITRFLAVRCVK